MVMENLLTCFVNHNSMAFDLLFVFSMVKIQPVFNSFLNEKKQSGIEILYIPQLQFTSNYKEGFCFDKCYFL